MAFLKKCFPETTLVIDADLYMFRAAVSVEQEVQWSDTIWSLSSDVGAAKRVFEGMIETFKQELMTDQIILTFSGSQNFRRSVEPTYKASRKKTRKPVGYAALVDWASEKYNTICVDILEADDVMGIMMSIPDTKAVIISDDKDLMGIPGKLYRPQGNERLTISQTEADNFFLKQTLMGDVTDGYAGLKGCGPKGAEKILGARPSWGAVVAAYAKENLNEDTALTQARLARILRHDDWDDEAGEVILWDPNK